MKIKLPVVPKDVAPLRHAQRASVLPAQCICLHMGGGGGEAVGSRHEQANEASRQWRHALHNRGVVVVMLHGRDDVTGVRQRQAKSLPARNSDFNVFFPPEGHACHSADRPCSPCVQISYCSFSAWSLDIPFASAHSCSSPIFGSMKRLAAR